MVPAELIVFTLRIQYKFIIRTNLFGPGPVSLNQVDCTVYRNSITIFYKKKENNFFAASCLSCLVADSAHCYYLSLETRC